MFQGQFDIANKTLVQCYLLDEEMFVGEQRFVEDDIRKFMEYFCSQMEEIEETKIAEATKGITAKIKAGDKFMVEEEDPDFEANKDLVIKEVSSESESESEEESEYSESDSDEEEEEEQEEDEEEVDEEEEEDEVEKPTARFKQDQDLSSARLKQEDSSVEQSEEVSESQVKEEDEEEEEDDSDAEEEEDEEDEEGEDEDEDEEEEDPKLNPANSNGGSLHSTEYNTKNLSLKTLLSNKPGGGAAFQGDAPSIFSKSKIQNSTIKIEDYDNDDTDGQYRL
mgnify:CR=1 FL=1